jgi:RimJ/RimL family protein N-acetyltransferase
MGEPRLRVEWHGADGAFAAAEPSESEVRARALELALAYNDPHNSAMMANTLSFGEGDVVAHYEAMAKEGARQFFLYERASAREGEEAFVGDADFRNIAGRAVRKAEFAMLIASRANQGKGRGTRFALLLHALAFSALGLERVYVTIVPENVASQRLFTKIGYIRDPSPEARAYVDDERDVAMSLGRPEFERDQAPLIQSLRITPR